MKELPYNIFHKNDKKKILIGHYFEFMDFVFA